MKILIFGNGWIGSMLKEAWGADMHIGLIQDADESVIEAYDVIVNCAAETNIDRCEKEKRIAYENNVAAALHLAHLCRIHGKKYVFFSTGCIFESQHPIDVKFEDSRPSPQCFYAETKWMAEQLIAEENPDALIVRPRLLISGTPHLKNLMDKILSYPNLRIDKESMTVAEDMIPALKGLIESGASGVYHLVNKGTIAPYTIAILYGSGGHKPMGKKKFESYLRETGKAKRVTVNLGSRRIPFLPPIKIRIRELIAHHKKAKKHEGIV